MMKAPVLFLIFALASAEAFACESAPIFDDSLFTVQLGDFSPCFGTWALLCDKCGGGENRFCCVRCGQSGARIQAMLCPQCSSIRRYCVKCGKPGARIPARLCDQCGYGEKKKECVKCGKIFR
ncbi:MAG: hypothetical protein IJF84_00815 [Thermoguttaceae bacterium]|nr:hypothetical protein [Thermoguttaceae bacterium]